jgi:hypothetical protein
MQLISQVPLLPVLTRNCIWAAFGCTDTSKRTQRSEPVPWQQRPFRTLDTVYVLLGFAERLAVKVVTAEQVLHEDCAKLLT